jgi:DNA-binding NarL/FixJ family response regulator
MNTADRDLILARYDRRAVLFDRIAARRSDEPVPVPQARVSIADAGETPSQREMQVLTLAADGLANREIAQTLYVSEETVKTHVRKLLAKLNAQSRAHAVAIGFRQGLIS